jgi:hypothetical protein
MAELENGKTVSLEELADLFDGTVAFISSRCS